MELAPVWRDCPKQLQKCKLWSKGKIVNKIFFLISKKIILKKLKRAKKTQRIQRGEQKEKEKKREKQKTKT